ncbi:MAG TPA: ABC transporter ATP-binding protein [Solirubrobacterales bacterium]|nr:ABC transporter ATP-binding protein [Solirubrobacterales bacterium]
MAGPLLEIEDLKVDFGTDEGTVHAVDGVSFSLEAGEVLSIVGESGSGKSVTAMTILGLTRGINARIGGSVRYQGKELTTASDEELQTIRGDRIAMVFQDPMSSFNPVHKIGDQIVEAILAHRDMDKSEAHRRAVEALGSVGIPDPETRAGHYPFEYSGGMRQRAMIAMALALEPAILIADEPSTALDVTIQAQIIELLRDLNQEHGLSVVLITHDLGVVAEIADRVLVMYAGQIVEQGSLDEIFYDPQHPYTWGLLGSIARLDQARTERLSQIAGQPPSLLAPPPGCRFRPRCPHAFEKCSELPPLGQRLGTAKGHADRCWLDPADKKKLREVGGRIGLEVPA